MKKSQLNNMITQFVQQRVITICKISFVAFVLLFSYQAYAATLSVSPGTGVYTAGQTFTARVVVNTSGKAINAADGTLKFNPNELSVVSVSKGTTFNLWTAEPAFSNSAGTVTFSGGTPTGYTGSAGTVINVTFRAKAAGSPKVTFSNGSVLAADGLGTNVLTSMSGGSYTIAAADVTPEPETIEYIAPANTPGTPQITSTTHPNDSSWYQTKDAELAWTLPGDVVAIRTLLDSNSGSIPTKVYDTPISSIRLSDLDEGVQYFHLQFKNAEGWGRVAHYRLAVDTAKPTKFEIALAEDADLSSPNQTLYFTTEDATSRVATFKVQLDGGEPFEYTDQTGSSTMLLSELSPGYHSLIIEAFDEAGNSIIGSFSFSVLAFDRPQFTEYPSEINEEVIPVIKGITRPNSRVDVTVIRLNSTAEDATRTYTMQSAEDGVFSFIPDGTFTLGVYELTAVATDQYGAQSEVSDPIRIVVQQPGYLKIGSLVVNILSVVIPLLALLALFFIGMWYLIFRLRSLRSSVSRETQEALSILNKEFTALHTEFEKQKELLIASRKTKKLTKAEEKLIETMNASLDKAQKRVAKEVGDVEDIVE